MCGGREYADSDKVFAVMDVLCLRLGITAVVAGGQRGADSLAKAWAVARGVRFIEEPVSSEEWKKLGRAAGPIRNRRMLKHGPGRVIAFPGGDGTADMLDQARRAAVKCIEVG